MMAPALQIEIDRLWERAVMLNLPVDKLLWVMNLGSYRELKTFGIQNGQYLDTSTSEHNGTMKGIPIVVACGDMDNMPGVSLTMKV